MVPDSKPAMRNARSLSKKKTLLFSAAVVVGLFVCANSVVSLLERGGKLKTLTPVEGIQFVDRPLLKRQGDLLVTTDYAESSMTTNRLVAGDFGGWRAALIGGSFMFGDPYTKPGRTPDNLKRQGGIADWLREMLSSLGPTEPVEVLNFAAPAQNSERVKQIAGILLQHELDVLIVGTGNNEGAMTPHASKLFLRKFAGFRLMWRILRPRPKGDIPVYAPQQGTSEQLLAQYTENIESIAKGAEQAGVPVLFSVMPINLRQGWQPARYRRLIAEESPGWTSEVPPWFELVRPLPPTPEELAFTEELEAEKSIDPGLMAKYYTMLGIRQIRAGKLEEGRTSLGKFNGPCAAEGVEFWVASDFEAAIEALAGCSVYGHPLRWVGGALYEQGLIDEAVMALGELADRAPGGRTRPSYNHAVRALAAKYEHVYLADLHARARRVSPSSVPGEELFVDNCHMNWRGYAEMASEVLDTLLENGLGPAGAAPRPEALPSPDVVRLKWGLEPLPQLVSAEASGGD